MKATRSMLAALGLGGTASGRDSEAVVSRLVGLIKDPRGWQETMALVLRMVPPDTQV